MEHQIGRTCPLCAAEYTEPEIVQVPEPEDEMWRADHPENVQTMTLREYLRLDCGHAFPRQTFKEFQKWATKHDKVLRMRERKSGVYRSALEHYLEDVIHTTIEQLQAQCIEHVLAKPNEDEYA